MFAFFWAYVIIILMSKFAVIETGGKQYKVSAGQKVKIEKVDASAGANFVFENVLLVGDSAAPAQTQIGAPYIAGAKVEGRILSQARGEKKTIFRYHSKTRHRRKKGHRQPYAEVEIVKV